MHLYEKSEELVRLLEQRVQEETNDSFKSQYQILLQQQRNASASLKSLAEARGSMQPQASQQQASQQASQQAQQKAQQQAQQQGASANSYNQEFGSETHVDTSSMTQAQKNATMNQRKEAGALDNDQKGSSNK
jgi:hypothetical protein